MIIAVAPVFDDRHVHVGTKAIASEVQDDKQQDQQEEDNHPYLHPTWGVGDPSACGPGRILLCRASYEDVSH